MGAFLQVSTLMGDYSSFWSKVATPSVANSRVPLWMWKWPNTASGWSYMCCQCTVPWQYRRKLHVHVPPWLPRC